MNYTAILRRAFQITWRQRALWLFGFLLALFSGGHGGGGGGSGRAGPTIEYHMNGPDLQWPGIDWSAIWLVLAIAAVVILLLIVVSTIVSYVSIGALIGMVDEADRAETTSIRSGFRTGWRRFLRLFAIALVIYAPVLIVVLGSLLLVLVPLPLVIQGARMNADAPVVLGVLAMVALFLIWLAFLFVVAAGASVLSEFAYRRCVLAQVGVFRSIEQGYGMIRRHLRDAGLTWLLLLGINIVVGVVLLPLTLIVIALAVGAGFAAWTLAGFVVAAVLSGVAVLVVLGAALAFVEGLVIVYNSTVWTLVYREIDARSVNR